MVNNTTYYANNERKIKALVPRDQRPDCCFHISSIASFGQALWNIYNKAEGQTDFYFAASMDDKIVMTSFYHIKIENRAFLFITSFLVLFFVLSDHSEFLPVLKISSTSANPIKSVKRFLRESSTFTTSVQMGLYFPLHSRYVVCIFKMICSINCTVDLPCNNDFWEEVIFLGVGDSPLTIGQCLLLLVVFCMATQYPHYMHKYSQRLKLWKISIGRHEPMRSDEVCMHH